MADETAAPESDGPSGDETAAFLQVVTSLPSAQVYTDADRYRDFRQLFMGSDQGQRVFRELLAWGQLFRPAIQGKPIDPILMGINTGERNFALRILTTCCVEPKAQRPARAKSTAKKD